MAQFIFDTLATASGAEPQLSVYGTVHTYRIADGAASQMPVATGNGGAAAAGSRRIGIPYE